MAVSVQGGDAVEASGSFDRTLSFGQKFVPFQVDCHAEFASRHGLEHTRDPAPAADSHILGKRDL